LKFSFIRHFATKITIYVFDEKNNIKKLRLSAKHKPLNVDAKINQHLRSIFFFFFCLWEKQLGGNECKKIPEISDSRQFPIVLYSASFMFVEVNFETTVGVTSAIKLQSIDVLFGGCDRNVSSLPSLVPSPFTIVTSSSWRRIILFSRLWHKSFLRCSWDT